MGKLTDTQLKIISEVSAMTAAKRADALGDNPFKELIIAGALAQSASHVSACISQGATFEQILGAILGIENKDN